MARDVQPETGKADKGLKDQQMISPSTMTCNCDFFPTRTTKNCRSLLP